MLFTFKLKTNIQKTAKRNKLIAIIQKLFLRKYKVMVNGGRFSTKYIFKANFIVNNVTK